MIVLVLLNAFAIAQSVGIGTITPHASAQLDISSTNKGTLITTMTSVQRKAIPNPAVGLLVFDIDKKTIYLFDGAKWFPMLFSTTEKNPPTYLQPTTNSADANFGYRVDIYGDYAIVGSRNALVIENSSRSGEAYIFHKDNGVWKQQDRLIPNDGEEDDYFGASVAINDDFAVVGAWGDDVGADASQGSVYIFSRVGEVWSQQNKITASDGLANDFFGYSVDISNTNNLVVGAYGDNIGANTDQGSAYVYQGSAGLGGYIWALQAKLTASDGAALDYFGSSVSIYNNNIVIGAYGDDVGVNTDQGSVYTFYKFTDPGGWTTGQAYFQKLNSSDGEAFDYFGISVEINLTLLVIGASGDDVGANSDQGSAYIYTHPGGGPPPMMFTAKIVAQDGAASDNFGISVSLGNNNLAIGAYRADDSDGISNKGAVYLYKSPQIIAIYPSVFYRKVLDETGQANGYFGFSVGVYGYDVIIGAYGKNSTNGQVAFLNMD